MYTYKAKLIRVIEGDTIDADIDLGFDISIRMRIKLFGISTPDPKSKDFDIREQGLVVKSKLIELLPKEFVIETLHNKRGKYGRTMGIVYVKDENNKLININHTLIDLGLAEDYNGVR